MELGIGFIGAGQMAEAIAKGLVKKGAVLPNRICCTDPVQARKDIFKGFGATAYDTGKDVISRPEQNSSCFFSRGLIPHCLPKKGDDWKDKREVIPTGAESE